MLSNTRQEFLGLGMWGSKEYMSSSEFLAWDKRRSPILYSHEDITVINPVKKAEMVLYLNSLSTSTSTYFAFTILKSIKSYLIKNHRGLQQKWH